jgi:hypothetical protein
VKNVDVEKTEVKSSFISYIISRINNRIIKISTYAAGISFYVRKVS